MCIILVYILNELSNHMSLENKKKKLNVCLNVFVLKV